METMLQDIRFALRSMIKSPGFALVSTITLALAIGVNTSIFSIVNAIVFADLPMQDSETIALVRGTNAELGVDQGSVSPADYYDLQERARSYESLSALTQDVFAYTSGDQPMRVEAILANPGLFQTWSLPPILGREFIDGEDLDGAARVAMLTHGFWQDQFAGSPDVIGTVVTLDDLEYTVVGVADPAFEFANFAAASLIVPLVLDRTDLSRTSRSLLVVGRLAPGFSQDMAAEEARAIGEQLAAEYPAENRGWTLWSAPAMESLIDDEANRILLLLQLTVGMVILIACANVANMLLARASARAREMAVRAALGAGRARLIRQLLTESVVISLAAAALGLGVAWSLNRTLIWISAGTEVVFQMAVLDRRVLFFTLLVSLAAPMFFGLLPALRASASSASGTLRDSRSTDGGRSGKRVRGALVTAQVSLALSLMVLATLLTRTVINLNTRPLGFDAADVMTVRIDLPEGRYDEDGTVRFFADARQAMSGVPGFDAVELVNVLPGAGFGARRSLEVEGVELPEGRAAPTAEFVTVSDGYFDLLGLEMQSGRGFVATDVAESFPVAVVSRETAENFWPGEDPVGRRFRVADGADWTQVVGVVSNVRSSTESERPSMNVYVPHAQERRRGMYLISRTPVDPATVGASLRTAIWSVDPTLPVDPPRTLERAHYEASATSFALITLFGTFAVFALLMAAVGIYGVMAYSVAQRRTEIGLRMAIGAETGAIRWMVLRQGAKLLAWGVGIGLVVAFGLSRLVQSLVFGVSATDPATFVGVPLVLTLVALVANLIPAVRATQTNPSTTLRGD